MNYSEDRFEVREYFTQVAYVKGSETFLTFLSIKAFDWQWWISITIKWPGCEVGGNQLKYLSLDNLVSNKPAKLAGRREAVYVPIVAPRNSELIVQLINVLLFHNLRLAWCRQLFSEQHNSINYYFAPFLD